MRRESNIWHVTEVAARLSTSNPIESPISPSPSPSPIHTHSHHRPRVVRAAECLPNRGTVRLSDGLRRAVSAQAGQLHHRISCVELVTYMPPTVKKAPMRAIRT